VVGGVEGGRGKLGKRGKKEQDVSKFWAISSTLGVQNLKYLQTRLIKIKTVFIFEIYDKFCIRKAPSAIKMIFLIFW